MSLYIHVTLLEINVSHDHLLCVAEGIVVCSNEVVCVK